MENILIRAATIEDLEVLLYFEQELIKAERPFDPTIKKDPVSYYDIESFILDDEVDVVVAECNGKVVSSGYVYAKSARDYLDHKEYAYMGFMYTVPEYRGRGINKRIIERLKTWALSRDLTEMRLTVYSDNQPAIRAYEKVGFSNHLVEMRMRAD